MKWATSSSLLFVRKNMVIIAIGRQYSLYEINNSSDLKLKIISQTPLLPVSHSFLSSHCNAG